MDRHPVSGESKDWEERDPLNALQLAENVYKHALQETATFTEPYDGGRYAIGVDLAYLLGAIACGTRVRWDANDSFPRFLAACPMDQYSYSDGPSGVGRTGSVSPRHPLSSGPAAVVMPQTRGERVGVNDGNEKRMVSEARERRVFPRGF